MPGAFYPGSTYPGEYGPEGTAASAHTVAGRIDAVCTLHARYHAELAVVEEPPGEYGGTLPPQYFPPPVYAFDRTLTLHARPAADVRGITGHDRAAALTLRADSDVTRRIMVADVSPVPLRVRDRVSGHRDIDPWLAATLTAQAQVTTRRDLTEAPVGWLRAADTPDTTSRVRELRAADSELLGLLEDLLVDE